MMIINVLTLYMWSLRWLEMQFDNYFLFLYLTVLNPQKTGNETFSFQESGARFYNWEFPRVEYRIFLYTPHLISCLLTFRLLLQHIRSWKNVIYQDDASTCEILYKNRKLNPSKQSVKCDYDQEMRLVFTYTYFGWVKTLNLRANS